MWVVKVREEIWAKIITQLNSRTVNSYQRLHVFLDIVCKTDFYVKF